MRCGDNLSFSKCQRLAAGALCIFLALAGQPVHGAEYSPAERDWMDSHKAVRAGFVAVHPPFSVANKSGEPSGIDVDMLDQLVGGMKLQILPKYSGSGAEAVDGVRSGELDLLVGVTRTPELEKAFLFTEPYLSFPVAILAGEDAVFFSTPAGLAGKRVAVVRSSVAFTADVIENPAIYDTLEAALRALGRERVQAVVADPLEASYVIKNCGLSGLKVVGMLDQRHELRIAVRRDWPELVSILNQRIGSMSPLGKQAVCDAWAPPARPATAVGARVGWVVFVVGICACGISLSYVFRRSRRNEQLHAERAHLQRELNRKSEQATSLHGEKARLLQLTSRDVSQPLAGIRAHAARLSSDNLTAAAIRESGDEIGVQAVRIQKALEALQEIQALDEGSKVIKVTAVNVGAVVGEALANLEAAAAKRHVRLSPPSAGQTALALADVDVLRKVIESLLVGSLKIAPSGSAISIAIWPAEDRVLITVSDEGPGVSVADQSKVFGSYHHLGGSLSDAENSAGYGLALVQNLVKAMNAWLWYESTPGVGATYVIELPVVSSDGRPGRSGKLEKSTRSLADLGLRVLSSQK